jgi:putative hemolysin
VLRVSLEVAIVILLIGVNGFLAMSEMALVSARAARLQHRAAEGDGGAARALALSSDPNRFLSTVQVGITLIGILAGAFGGATLARTIREGLDDAGVAYPGPIAVALVVAGITFLSLVLGELVPKRIALQHPERISSVVARPMQAIATVARPAVYLLSMVTNFVLRVLRVRAVEGPDVSEEEIRILIANATEAGVLADVEQEMVVGVFRLADLRVGELMTPRPRMRWVDLEDSEDMQWQEVERWEHGIYPACRGDPDHVAGVVTIRGAWLATAGGRRPPMEDIIDPATFVPETALALNALEALKSHGAKLAIVVDEHGGTAGLITLTDIVEAIVGSMPERGQAEEAGAVQDADGNWLIDGMLAAYEVKELLGLDELPDEGDYTTLAGFIVHQMERIPTAGEDVDFEGYRFRVVDMDGQRVDKVMVMPVGDSSIPRSGHSE